jgi:protein-tyrosine phosphatase
MIDILLVCTANICRSPMAQGLFVARTRLLHDPPRVKTAGTGAARGHPPTGHAVTAAAELGADIAAHRSSPLGQAAAEADLVLTMTAAHREEVVLRVPEAAPRAFSLKELADLIRNLPPPAGTPSRATALARIEEAHRLRERRPTEAAPDADVSDPIGLSLEAYRAAAWEIDGAVQDIVEGLFGGPNEKASR